MDTKGMAKSKRAHSQQHSRKHHLNQKSKAPQRSSGVVASTLPSNSDRYEEENEDDDPSATIANVVSKSKGADYRHLISEAQSQSNLYVDHLVADEFSEALGSMLSVKGDGILAWLGDDNFVVDDKISSNPEASFLSLNLHVLAQHLEKVDLSQRLFIEADLLPPEMLAEVSESSRARECDQMPSTNEIAANTQISEGLSYIDSSSVKLENEDRTSNTTPVVAFEAASAEAELDKLLDSFNEIDILGSTDALLGQNETFMAAFQSPRKKPDSAVLPSVNMDDDLDDLLNKASTLIRHNNASQNLQPSSSNSEVLNEFDSWLDTL